MEGVFGNPSSIHRFGQEARKVLESAREKVAALLGARPREVVFTASGSEADALALLGVALARGRGHVVSTGVEHSAVLGALRLLERLGFSVTRLRPDRHGLVYPEQVEEALREDTFLVSVMAANNELGTLYPVKEIAQVAHAHGALFHTDAVQAVGQVPFSVEEVGADLLSLSAHKFYGPKGIGASWCATGWSFFPWFRASRRGEGGGAPRAPSWPTVWRWPWRRPCGSFLGRPPGSSACASASRPASWPWRGWSSTATPKGGSPSW